MRGSWRRTNPRRSSPISGGVGNLNRRGSDPESGFRRLARRDPLHLLILLLAAAVLITLPHRHQLALATTVRSTVLAPVLQLQSGLSDMQLMRGTVEELRAERDSLSALLHALSNVDEENLRLRGFVGLAQRVGHTFKPANLRPVGRAGEVVQRSFVLDAGERSGIAADAPVVAPGGLVGVVRVASPGRAIGDFWTHPEFRVSAMTADGNVFGIIKSLGSQPLLMQLDGAPYQLELASGTQLVTSGQGGVFPRGIPIGQVIEVVSTQEGWSKSYLVRPSVYPDAVREVMVLVDSLGAVDPAAVWGWEPADTVP